jgi:hypothetical protein
MIVKVSSIIKTTPEILWEQIQRTKSLQYISAPILYFIPKKDTVLKDGWETNKEYNLSLFLLKFIPLGQHKIVINKISQDTNEIVSSESGLLAKTWNHKIKFDAINSKQIMYTDTVEIKAGLLTIFIWLFAQIFYRHRQRRWRGFLAKVTLSKTSQRH